MSRDWLADYASAILSARERMYQYFDPSLFADPARDILLDLFAREQRGLDTSASDCTAAARVPPAAALCWIDVLLNGGLIASAPSPEDTGTPLMRLTPHAKSLMVKYLCNLATEPGLRPMWSSIIIE